MYNRGNAKADIFSHPEDYRFFLRRLESCLFPEREINYRGTLLPSGSFTLIAYCLMPNHFHFLIRQNGDISTGQLMRKLCTSYSMYFNRKNDRVGHVFQDQFKQAHIDTNSYLVWLSAYIHANPVVANMVRGADQYPWSSYHQYMGVEHGICDVGIVREQYPNPAMYAELVQEGSALTKRLKGTELLDS